MCQNDESLSEADILVSKLLFDTDDMSSDTSPENEHVAQTIWSQQLAVWTDPFTPPHSRSVCVKWAKPWPGAKVCVGWKTQWQYMQGHLWVIVTLASPADIAAAIQAALKDAAVASAISAIVTAYVTGGTGAGAAALDTFTTVFERDLAARIAEKIISVRAENRSAWSNYQ